MKDSPICFMQSSLGGKYVIKPEELPSVDSKVVFVLEHGENAQSVQQAWGKINICRHSTTLGVELELFGEENQEPIHYGMPMRLIGYDCHTYKNSMTTMLKSTKRIQKH